MIRHSGRGWRQDQQRDSDERWEKDYRATPQNIGPTFFNTFNPKTNPRLNPGPKVTQNGVYAAISKIWKSNIVIPGGRRRVRI